MLAMGDEAGRTQNGNNNAYAQDNATTWLDWPAMDTDLVSFVATLTALRQAHPALHDDRWLRGEPVDASGIPDVQWRHADGRVMGDADWANPEGRVVVAALYRPASERVAADHVAIALNASDVEVAIRWPDARDGFHWRRKVDTARPAGTHDSCSAGEFDMIAARSVVVLVEQTGSETRRGSPGIEPEMLDRLTRAAGIAPEWTDVQGRRHAVGDDTRRALLAAMGLEATTTGQARARLAELAARRERRFLPRTLVVLEDQEMRVPIAVDDRKRPRHGALRVA